MIKLGSKVRDTITGFEGIAVARTEWLHGCVRINIEPDELDDAGKPIDAFCVDEQRVELVEQRTPAVSPASSATSGGPQRDPRPPAAPRR